jgi:hypothetical protein
MVRDRVKHVLLPALLGLPLLAAAGKAGSAPWKEAPEIPAESDLLRDRVRDPQRHFLQDGQHAFVAGREFHQAFGDPQTFLWPLNPYQKILPDRRWLRDSAECTYSMKVGNEVGDPLFHELEADREWGNRTPLTAGALTWSPTGDWSLHAGLDQNDHFSFRTYPDRLALVGEKRREELSFIGGNLPPQSLAQAGGAWLQHGGIIAAQANRGWWWTNSPVSGMPYAWKGFNAEIYSRAGDDFDMSLVDQSWESAAPGSFQASRWRRTEVNLGFGGGGSGGWRWRLELGGQRRTLYSDSAFVRFQEDIFPWRFRYRQVWSPEAGSFLKLENQGFLGNRDRMFSAQHLLDLKETWGRHTLGQGLKGYYRHPFPSYREQTEILNADTTWTAMLDPATHARGLSGSGEYRYARDRFEASLSGHYAVEWGIPIFRGSVVDTLETLLIRSGTLVGSDHHYTNFGGELEAAGAIWGPAFWRFQAGLRGFEGAEADQVEYRPSPWWTALSLGADLPSDLRLEALVHWVGPKEVRGWGETYEVPSHLEGNTALVQRLFEDRLKLSASFLHAFGDAVQEHPNGNPLVFRIMVGVEGYF